MKMPSWPNPKGYRDIDLGLTRVYDLLARIGNPHEKLPPTIHVAGTNGKGSTIAFLSSILQNFGHKTHIYTSPHLTEFNERIILANEKISDNFLNECLEICKKACEIEPKIEPTFFEGITAAAFLAFSKVEADFLLLETGMGGRLDATNVITKNLCSIITPISFDHTEFLGDNLAKIAFEKASIIKPNCPVFVAKQEPEALEVIKKYAKKMGSEMRIFGQDFDYKINENNWEFLQNDKELDSGFRQNDDDGCDKRDSGLRQNDSDINNENDDIYKTKKWRSTLTLPFSQFLAGTHQIHNASIALDIIISQNLTFVKQNRKFRPEILGNCLQIGGGHMGPPLRDKRNRNIGDIYAHSCTGRPMCLPQNLVKNTLKSLKNRVFFTKIVKNAIKNTKWAARLQKIENGRFFSKIPKNCQIFVDGSHNLAGAATLQEFLQKNKNKKRILIFAMLKDKNSHDFLSKLQNETDFLIASEIENEEKSQKSTEILKIANELKIKCDTTQNLEEAFEKSLLQIDKNSLILICGSLYFAGEFLSKNSLKNHRNHEN